MESEVLRFQREIERASQEKYRLDEFLQQKQKRKSSRFGSSMDSLLSVDELPGELSNVPPPKLPPKAKFVSTGNLAAAPPALPPKLRNSNSGKVLKRVAISTDEVRIIGIGGYSDDNSDFVYDDDHDTYR